MDKKIKIKALSEFFFFFFTLVPPPKDPAFAAVFRGGTALRAAWGRAPRWGVPVRRLGWPARYECGGRCAGWWWGLNKGLPSRGLVLSVPAPLNASHISPPRCCETQYRPSVQKRARRSFTVLSVKRTLGGEREREKKIHHQGSPYTKFQVLSLPGVRKVRVERSLMYIYVSVCTRRF